MVNGYVGIVSRRGLCQLQVERYDTIRRASQAPMMGDKPPRVGFWATLADDSARHIAGLLDQDEGKEALRLLNQVAIESGHLLPLNQ